MTLISFAVADAPKLVISYYRRDSIAYKEIVDYCIRLQ